MDNTLFNVQNYIYAKLVKYNMKNEDALQASFEIAETILQNLPKPKEGKGWNLLGQIVSILPSILTKRK